MRLGFLALALAIASTLAFTPAVDAQDRPQAGAAAKAQAFAPHDLSGAWWRHGKSGSTLSRNNVPPMTPWAQARYTANKPGIGRAERVVPLGNDPAMQCDPIGFPRVLVYAADPSEISQLHGRIIEFFDYFYVLRTIWTDGREIPKDPDPSW